jgi:serine/threonine-protein kinase
MPPEQARDAKHADARCDIYALGCTLYHFATGKLPFAGESVIELLKNKERGTFTPARRVNAAIPERLDLIIDKMMAKDPKHRYASCAEVIRDIESLNLAADSLSFIESDKKATLRRGIASAPRTTAMPRASIPPNKRPLRGKGKPSSARSAATPKEPSEDMWYVKFSDSAGKVKVSKMTTAQILQGLRSDLLTMQTRISRNAKEDFRPVAQVAVFETEAKKSLTRVRADKHQANMAKAYAKIERQYNRQKWWRLLARFRDGTLGFAGLILWLVLVAAAVIVFGIGVTYAYRFLGNSLNL